jgi:hypothetical protein
VISIPTLEHATPATLLRIGIAFALVVVVATCGLWSTLIHWEMMDKVNSCLPESQKFQALCWGPFKRAQLNAEYRRLFPDGKDLKRAYRLVAIMFGALLGLFVTVLSFR